MSDSIVNECLVHYNSQHIQVRKDFFDLCAYDKKLYNSKRNEKGNIIRDEPNQECMAKLLRLLETLTNDRKSNWYIKEIGRQKMGAAPSDEPEEYPIKLAYSAITELLYHTYGESTIRNSLAVLIEWGYIKRYQENAGATPLYALNIPALQKALVKQAKKPSQPAKKRVLNLTPSVVNVRPPSSNSTARGVNSTPNKKENKITDSNKTNSKKESASTSINKETAIPSILSPDQQKYFDTIYCQSKIGRIVPDSIDEILKRHIVKLMQHAKTVEALDSLYDYAKKKVEEEDKKDKTVYPGNLTNAKYLNGWMQEQERTTTQDRWFSADTMGDVSGKLAEKLRGKGLITSGPLAGQPAYDADPWL